MPWKAWTCLALSPSLLTGTAAALNSEMKYREDAGVPAQADSHFQTPRAGNP